MQRPIPIYIVASPNPKVGKTLIARVLIEFVQKAGRKVVGYDLPTRKSELAERFPHLVESVDIADTHGQMRVFDQLLVDRATTKIVDLGSGPFDLFFAVMEKIDFVTEARQHLIEPIVLYVADGEPETARTYADLRRRLKSTIFIPVHNEAVSVVFAPHDYVTNGIECGPIRIARLSYLVRRVIDRANFSFASFMTNGDSEMHQWIGPILTRFRELELQIFANRLTLFLNPANRQNFQIEER
jgi:hypothetical protein